MTTKRLALLFLPLLLAPAFADPQSPEEEGTEDFTMTLLVSANGRVFFPPSSKWNPGNENNWVVTYDPVTDTEEWECIADYEGQGTKTFFHDGADNVWSALHYVGMVVIVHFTGGSISAVDYPDHEF